MSHKILNRDSFLPFTTMPPVAHNAVFSCFYSHLRLFIVSTQQDYVNQLYSGRSRINVEWVAGTERKSIASILD